MIIGRLIPAGTGRKDYRQVNVTSKNEIDISSDSIREEELVEDLLKE